MQEQLENLGWMELHEEQRIRFYYNRLKLEKMAISGFSGFFGKLLVVIIFFLGSGYIGSKLIGSE